MITTYQDVDLTELIQAVRRAGAAILDIYQRDFAVEYKEDASPLTEADQAAHEVLTEYLSQTPYPVLSEEGAKLPYAERREWGQFWLVDPLDGTKEFIKKNGEFTVNVALVQGQNPVLGLVYQPVGEVLYVGALGEGAWKQVGDGAPQGISAGSHYRELSQVRVVASRSHVTPGVQEFVEKLVAQGKEIEYQAAGSSLKICLVAEGRADVYPRLGPTMEWDTAAADAVARAAGRQVLDAVNREPLVYNKEDLLNPHFFVE